MARPTLYVLELTTVDRERHREHTEAHKAWVTKHAAAGTFLLCGPSEDRASGGIIVARAASRAELDAVLAEDPFRVHGAAMHRVTAFSLSLGALADLLN